MTVAAGTVGDAFVRAILAALNASAERGGAAGLDRRHDLQLAEADMARVGLAPRRPMGAKDVGDLEGGRAMRPQSGGRRSAREVDAQPLERALDLADGTDGDARIERGRLELGVAEQYLDHANIDVLLEQMCGEAVSQGVRRHALGDTRQARGGVHGAPKLAGGHRVDRVLAGESQACGRPARHQSRSSSSSCGESITYRSRCPLPCSTRSVMRWLSISDTFRFATSDTRRPAP